MTLPTEGVVVPLVTPLTVAGEIDAESLESLVRFVFDAGVSGILVLGSCGESGALGTDSRLVAAEVAIGAARGRGSVIVGVSGLGTIEVVAETRRLSELGPDALMVYAPIVFSSSPTEIHTHFRCVSEAASVPVLAYDVPDRVRVALDPALVSDMATAGFIAGIKDSSNDLGKQRRLVEHTKAVPGFLLCTGAEEIIDGLFLAGFQVAIPGLANVVPSLHVALARAAAARDWATASARQADVVELLRLYDASLPNASFSAIVLGAMKEALRQLGVIESATTSLPFVHVDDGLSRHVREVLERAKEIVP